MSRIEIKAGNRHVVVEHGGELEHLRNTATALWDLTDVPAQTERGMGFQANDRRGTAPVAPSSMWRPPHPYPIQYDEATGGQPS